MMPAEQATISKRSRSPNPDRLKADEKSVQQKTEKRRRRTGWDVTEITQTDTPAQPHSPEVSTQNIDLNSSLITPPSASPPPIPTTSPMLCRIYVGSLDYYLTVEEVKRVFEAFGTIVTIDMPKEGDRSKGFCFVEFATPESAEMALSSMQGFPLKGRNIKVGRPSASGLPLPQPITPPLTTISPVVATSNPERASNMSPTEAGAIAAAAMISSKTNQDITSILKKTATVSPNVSNGLLTPQAALSAAGMISVNLPSVDPSQPSANRIYVGNVPANFTSTDLEQIFSVFGKILSCYVLPNNDIPGTHRGYGFIDFTEPTHAKLAIDTMNGFPVADKHLKVNYAASVRQPNTNFLPSASTQIIIPPNVVANISPPPITPSATGANTTPLGNPAASSNAALNSYHNNTYISSLPIPQPPQPPITQPAPPVTSPPAKPTNNTIKLSNMVDPDEIDPYLKTEIKNECMKYGQVLDVDIKIINNLAEIFVTFASDSDASRAIPFLNGRLFAGRQIACQIIPL